VGPRCFSRRFSPDPAKNAGDSGDSGDKIKSIIFTKRYDVFSVPGHRGRAGDSGDIFTARYDWLPPVFETRGNPGATLPASRMCRGLGPGRRLPPAPVTERRGNPPRPGPSRSWQGRYGLGHRIGAWARKDLSPCRREPEQRRDLVEVASLGSVKLPAFGDLVNAGGTSSGSGPRRGLRQGDDGACAHRLPSDSGRGGARPHRQRIGNPEGPRFVLRPSGSKVSLTHRPLV
jgi:hypothetical protein